MLLSGHSSFVMRLERVVNVRLAQLVERYIDIVEATGSSPVSDTLISKTCLMAGFCLFQPK